MGIVDGLNPPIKKVGQNRLAKLQKKHVSIARPQDDLQPKPRSVVEVKGHEQLRVTTVKPPPPSPAPTPETKKTRNDVEIQHGAWSSARDENPAATSEKVTKQSLDLAQPLSSLTEIKTPAQAEYSSMRRSEYVCARYAQEITALTAAAERREHTNQVLAAELAAALKMLKQLSEEAQSHKTAALTQSMACAAASKEKDMLRRAVTELMAANAELRSTTADAVAEVGWLRKSHRFKRERDIVTSTPSGTETEGKRDLPAPQSSPTPPPPAPVPVQVPPPPARNIDYVLGSESCSPVLRRRIQALVDDLNSTRFELTEARNATHRAEVSARLATIENTETNSDRKETQLKYEKEKRKSVALTIQIEELRKDLAEVVDVLTVTRRSLEQSTATRCNLAERNSLLQKEAALAVGEVEETAKQLAAVSLTTTKLREENVIIKTTAVRQQVEIDLLNERLQQEKLAAADIKTRALEWDAWSSSVEDELQHSHSRIQTLEKLLIRTRQISGETATFTAHSPPPKAHLAGGAAAAIRSVLERVGHQIATPAKKKP